MWESFGGCVCLTVPPSPLPLQASLVNINVVQVASNLKDIYSSIGIISERRHHPFTDHSAARLRDCLWYLFRRCRRRPRWTGRSRRNTRWISASSSAAVEAASFAPLCLNETCSTLNKTEWGRNEGGRVNGIMANWTKHIMRQPNWAQGCKNNKIPRLQQKRVVGNQNLVPSLCWITRRNCIPGSSMGTTNIGNDAIRRNYSTQ